VTVALLLFEIFIQLRGNSSTVSTTILDIKLIAVSMLELPWDEEKANAFLIL
jgi:hypothetical protein